MNDTDIGHTVPYVVAIDHPSLVHLVVPFASRLHDEPRRFGRAGVCNPKPFPSLIRRVTDRERRRFGVMSIGELVGMASLSVHGEVAMAVAAAHRGQGIGALLLEQMVVEAERAGHERLVMESSRRSRPIALLGQRYGWSVHELARGRVELTLQLRCRLTG